MSSLRWQRLDSVSRMFQSAYNTAVPLKTTRQSSGFSGMLGRFAEHVGLKGATSTEASSVNRGGF